MAYRAPQVQFQAAPTGAQKSHAVALVTRKGSIPGKIDQNLPAHLAAHAALRGEKGTKLVLHGSPSRLIFGVGSARDFSPQEASDHGEACGRALNAERLADVIVHFPDEITDPAVVLNFLKGMMLANFSIDEFRSKVEHDRAALKTITFTGKTAGKIPEKAIKDLLGIAKGIAFARELVELPAATASPEGVVKRFADALDKRVLSMEVWDEKRIKKEGMGLLEAVSRGSEVPPRFLIVRYGKEMTKKPTLFLVGKGVTFDTGGINIKAIPYKDLLGMKGDMAGAAAALGAMVAIAECRPQLPIVAITPLTVNAIGSKATLPGDIIRSYAGKTVEIQNTDAEGRLILADAMHYAVQQKADYIIDIATLTGACAVALGSHHTGLFTNHADFGDLVLEASVNAGEPGWPLPLSNRYGEELKSTLADLSNMGKGREGGASLGAKFIENFVDNTPWVHLDIAGSSDLSPVASGGSAGRAAGRMVHTLVESAQQLAAHVASSKKTK